MLNVSNLRPGHCAMVFYSGKWRRVRVINKNKPKRLLTWDYTKNGYRMFNTDKIGN